MSDSPGSYVGRFAPSPTGPLHFGSLVAAVGSYLDARAHGGKWLLRIEDLDTPRCVPGASDNIIASLERFGFEWDGEIVWQGRRLDAYHAALALLRDRGQVFGCACTRSEIADSALARDGSRVYPGTCRNGLPPGRSARAWRVRVEGQIAFDDTVQGLQREDVPVETGDFIVLRADGMFAYQLAVVVDDASAGVTDVVRGADLLDSTGRQICLLRLLGLPTPRYAHLPVAVNDRGEKLSKQTRANAIDDTNPQLGWLAALAFLGQNPPDSLRDASLAEVCQWSIKHWSLANVPRTRQARTPSAYHGVATPAGPALPRNPQ